MNRKRNKTQIIIIYLSFKIVTVACILFYDGYNLVLQY